MVIILLGICFSYWKVLNFEREKFSPGLSEVKIISSSVYNAFRKKISYLCANFNLLRPPQRMVRLSFTKLPLPTAEMQ